MDPLFFALFSKAGIACAADTDHTIHLLSKDLPVALAINPASPIPWEEIIEAYKAGIDRKPRAHFVDYMSDFETFLSTYEADGKLADLSDTDSYVMFFGYGADDIFPSVCDAAVTRENGKLGFDRALSPRQVTHKDYAFLKYYGDFDNVSTLFFGADNDTRKFFNDKYIDIWKEYADRVEEKFKGTQYEKYVDEHLENFDYAHRIGAIVNHATRMSEKELSYGVTSFSIEDMVTAVETIVNANAKLNHLLHFSSRGKAGETKEIAVITIPEGLTWIKHSLYMRRNEI